MKGLDRVERLRGLTFSSEEPFLDHPSVVSCRSAVAQPVEGPSKVPVWCNFTGVGSNQAHAIGIRQKKS